MLILWPLRPVFIFDHILIQSVTSNYQWNPLPRFTTAVPEWQLFMGGNKKSWQMWSSEAADSWKRWAMLSLISCARGHSQKKCIALDDVRYVKTELIIPQWPPLSASAFKTLDRCTFWLPVLAIHRHSAVLYFPYYSVFLCFIFISSLSSRPPELLWLWHCSKDGFLLFQDM